MLASTESERRQDVIQEHQSSPSRSDHERAVNCFKNINIGICSDRDKGRSPRAYCKLCRSIDMDKL